MPYKHQLTPIAIIISIILSLACCMVPNQYEGSIHQQSQEALLYFDNGVEDLILKVSPTITGSAQLDHFAWIITVPNEPDQYETVKNDIFNKLFLLKEKFLVKPIPTPEGLHKNSEFKDTPTSIGVELGKRVQVGAYDIQPVRGVGVNAFADLNSWLKTNNFPTEPESHMKYFIDNHFTFLCIKVKLNQDESNSKLRHPNLDPLHLTFKTDQMYYPMKYSSQQGNFSVNLYTLTTMPLDFKNSAEVLNRIDYSNNDILKNIDLTNKIKNETIAEFISNKNHDHLYFNNLFCEYPNQNGAISNWTKDVFFSLDNSHQPNDANMIETNNPKQIKVILLSLALFGTIFIIFRIRRKNI